MESMKILIYCTALLLVETTQAVATCSDDGKSDDPGKNKTVLYTMHIIRQ